MNFTFHSTLDNFVANVLLFLPVGFFYRLAIPRRGAVLLGAGLSLVVREAMQLFIPWRIYYVLDILANAFGAGLGAVLHDLVSTRLVITPSIMGRLRLETPLMGLIYLLIPLLWIDVLTLNESPNHWILTLLLGLSGAIIFSNLFRHWWQSVNCK